MPAVAEAEHTQTTHLTTETVLETYDVQTLGYMVGVWLVGWLVGSKLK